MSKKSAAILLCILVAVVGVFVLPTTTLRGRAQNDVSARQPMPIPEHVAYEFLFRRREFAKQRVEELERKGKNAKDVRAIVKDEAKLDDRETAVLDEVGFACLREAKVLDDEAMQIIKAARSRYPDGTIPQGERPPELPRELVIMQEQRDDIFRRGRVNLQAALGDEGFHKLDRYVNDRIANKVRPETPIN